MPTRLPRRQDVEKEPDDLDDEGVGFVGCIAKLLCGIPALIIGGIIFPLMAIAFIVVGAVYVQECNLNPLIPVWLIVQGVLMLLGAGAGGLGRQQRKKDNVSFPVKILGGVLSLIGFAWFIAGNVFVYTAWGTEPDYAHPWFENGCNKSAFNLAFFGMIIYDALIGILIILGCCMGIFIKTRK